MDRTDAFEGREAVNELAGPRRMTDLLLVALGGCIGAVLRYVLSAAITRGVDADFPWGTFTVNVLGAFVLGVLVALTVDRGVLPDILRPAFGIGLLGAFTTFSTFAMDAVLLAEGGQVVLAVSYVVLTNVIGVAAAVAGLLLGRHL